MTEALTELLERTGKATKPDRDLDRAIVEALGFEFFGGRNPGWWDAPDPEKPHKGEWKSARLTASLDAALALCERVRTEQGLHVHTVDLLNEAVEAMLVRGWKPNQPLAPQLARYLIVVLLESLIERGEANALIAGDQS